MTSSSQPPIPHEIALPAPWQHVEFVSGEEFDSLEAMFGSKLNPEDLAGDDWRDDPIGLYPKSKRAWLATGRRWARLKNTETLREVLIRLQSFGEGKPQSVSAVLFPFTSASIEMTGSDLRTLPVAAIAGAYTYDDQVGSANLRTFLQLMQEVHEGTSPADPLPPASGTDRFAALVARQYRHLEESEPDAYIAGRMSEINGKPLATVQRWITHARKAGFLPQVKTGRPARKQK